MIREFGVLVNGFLQPFWWRRGESNPRPEALHSEDYMLSALLRLASTPAKARATSMRAILGFAQSRQTARQLWLASSGDAAQVTEVTIRP